MLGNAEWERSEPLGFAVEVDAGQSFEQHLHGDLSVQSCERRTQTEVGAGAERQMRIGTTPDVERVGFGEGRRITVCAGREHDALLTSRHPVAVDLDIATRPAQHEAHRRHHPEHLFDRVRDQAGILREPSQRIRVLEE